MLVRYNSIQIHVWNSFESYKVGDCMNKLVKEKAVRLSERNVMMARVMLPRRFEWDTYEKVLFIN